MKLYLGSNCETYFTTTTSYCTFCDKQAADMKMFKKNLALLLSNSVQAQNISLISAKEIVESFREVSELATIAKGKSKHI